MVSRQPEKLDDIVKIKSFPFDIEYIKQDIREPIKFNKSVDYLIHAAAESSTSLNIEDPMLLGDADVEGTKNVLEYAKVHRVKRVLFISSGAVYGKQPSGISHLHEEYEGVQEPLNSLNAYGFAKRRSENLCTFYHHHYGVNYTIARCFGFVGPYLPLDAHFAMGNFIRDGLNGGPIKVEGDGTNVRSYLYTNDLAEWLWAILLKGKTATAYNVGSDKAITLSDLAHLVRSCFDDRPDVDIKGKLGGEINRYVPGLKKIKNELGVLEKVPLLDGIKRTIAFHTKKINYH